MKIYICVLFLIRQIKVQTAEKVVHRPNRLEIEIAIAKLIKYESHGSDKILEGVI
jgi:hypothetical protein